MVQVSVTDGGMNRRIESRRRRRGRWEGKTESEDADKTPKSLQLERQRRACNAHARQVDPLRVSLGSPVFSG